jgi:hypothetical protein
VEKAGEKFAAVTFRQHAPHQQMHDAIMRFALPRSCDQRQRNDAGKDQ